MIPPLQHVAACTSCCLFYIMATSTSSCLLHIMFLPTHTVTAPHHDASYTSCCLLRIMLKHPHNVTFSTPCWFLHIMLSPPYHVVHPHRVAHPHQVEHPHHVCCINIMFAASTSCCRLHIILPFAPHHDDSPRSCCCLNIMLPHPHHVAVSTRLMVTFLFIRELNLAFTMMCGCRHGKTSASRRIRQRA